MRVAVLNALRQGLEKLLPYFLTFLKVKKWESCTEAVSLESLTRSQKTEGFFDEGSSVKRTASGTRKASLLSAIGGWEGCPGGVILEFLLPSFELKKRVMQGRLVSIPFLHFQADSCFVW